VAVDFDSPGTLSWDLGLEAHCCRDEVRVAKLLWRSTRSDHLI
jgi:hypothetical protein